MQTKKEFISKTFKALVAKTLFATKFGISTWHTYAENFTPNREEATVALIRGFKPDEDFLGKFRIRPSSMLLYFIAKRCEQFQHATFEANMAKMRRF